MTNPDVTVFVYIHNNFVTVVKGVSVTRDPDSKRTTVFSGVSGTSINFSVFATPAGNICNNFVTWDFPGKEWEMPFDPPHSE